MCGIAGIFHREPDRPVPTGLLEVMGRSIAHRGPDAEGFWSRPGIGLVHRRLSIIDLTGGGQPIGNEDGSIQVAFNGEIYNHETLRRQLVERGHVFGTRSDTEVLVHLYEDEGEELVTRLRGMFAFAIWDQRRRRLMLARDRLGIKPLYVYRDAAKLVFGSELKAILAHPEVGRELNEEALEDYLSFGMVPGPSSIFRRIEKLQPAHTLLIGVDDWDRAARSYWRLRFEPDEKPTAEEWQDRLRAKLAEAVRLHMIADVPVGAFLSGGIDSSVIATLAQRATSQPLETFAIGFEEEGFSELPYARQVARRLGTRHVEQIVRPDAVGLLEKFSAFWDEPFADASAIPTFLVSELAARSVKVVLTGDGGDEAFGGYLRYAHDLREGRLRGLLPAWLRRPLLGHLAQAWPKADWLPRPLRAKTLLTNLALEAGPAYANTLSICRSPLRRQLLHADVKAQLNGHRPERCIEQGHATAPAADGLAGMLAADTAILLPDDFLVKVDRASMAHGLEARPPLLDHELLELAARIPSNWKVHRGQTKWLLRRAYRQELPQELLERPKHGFDMPIDTWLRGPLNRMFEETVFANSAPVASLVDRQVLRKLQSAHRDGLGNHGQVLWSVLVLARWAERFMK
jgi:asparagine synthase (glutamine-hydrolysing)